MVVEGWEVAHQAVVNTVALQVAVGPEEEAGRAVAASAVLMEEGAMAVDSEA